MAKHISIILEISQRLYLTNLPQFITIENGKGDKPAKKTAKTTYRDYKNFNMEPFKIDLQGIDWPHRTMM